MRRLAIASSITVATLGIARVGLAHHEDFEPPAPFTLDGAAIGGATAARATPQHLTSTRIAAVGDGAP
jgi:hypothetical protein